MMVTGTRWYHNGSIVATQNAVTPSFTVPYQINTTPITLYINAPFTTDHSHTGTYTCSPNSMSFASPPGDTITLNAAREYVPILYNLNFCGLPNFPLKSNFCGKNFVDRLPSI